MARDGALYNRRSSGAHDQSTPRPRENNALGRATAGVVSARLGTSVLLSQGVGGVTGVFQLRPLQTAWENGVCGCTLQIRIKLHNRRAATHHNIDRLWHGVQVCKACRTHY